MIGVSSSTVESFSDPAISNIGGIPITKLPDGAALGSDDLQRWSNNRLLGRFGVSPHSVEKTAGGDWVVTLATGKTIDGFKSRRAAWKWIKRGGR
jgi:hypothetical protein